jgi:hypothetical protein
MSKAPLSKLRHEALRDTTWVGKTVPGAWLMIVAVVAGASLLAFLLH